MASFLAPPAPKPEFTDKGKVSKNFDNLRWQVFLGIFIGYAGFYIVRKNFSMAIPMLEPFGFEKGELGIVLSLNAIAYGFSKFIMASVSDRSNARRFLPLGLICAAISMLFMIVPIQFIGAEHKTWAIVVMAIFNFLVGWFNGMGWPPCGRVMTHWFSIKERGTWMSFWNCAHNVGGALVGPMAVYGAMWFGSWFYGTHEDYYFLIGTFAYPAAMAVLIAIIAYVLIRDNPQSCNLSSIEKWRNDYAKNYNEKSEQNISTKEIFRTVLSNKFLWYIAIANSFIYMVRYGCLDWAPTILTEKGIDIKNAGWAYFAYEIAAIPGTIICGWLSDKVFKGRRALPTILFMALVAVAIIIYWQFLDKIYVVLGCLIAIGFLIYGPVMLVGVQALDLAPKNAAGTAAGLTGFMGYVLGTAVLANIVIGYVAQMWGWDMTFILLLVSCGISILFMGLTYKEEKYLANNETKDNNKGIKKESVSEYPTPKGLHSLVKFIFAGVFISYVFAAILFGFFVPESVSIGSSKWILSGIGVFALFAISAFSCFFMLRCKQWALIIHIPLSILILLLLLFVLPPSFDSRIAVVLSTISIVLFFVLFYLSLFLKKNGVSGWQAFFSKDHTGIE